MYRIVLIIVFALVISWILWRIRTEQMDKELFGIFYQGIISFKGIFHPKNGEVLNSIRIFNYQLVLLLFLLLAFTGFLPIIIFGGHLSGLVLIVHVTIAPLFCVFYALSLLFWVHFQRFNKDDWHFIVSIRNKKNIASRQIFWQKVYFWLFMLASIPAILAIILGMYPFFGTQGQEVLLEIHRYSTLIMFIIFALHITSLSQISDNTRNKGKLV
jgi:hypothetical protein